jgi:uncharacterized repeat protein (TIGR03803 family)
MQRYRRSSRTCWRVALAVLAGIAGFASDTHGQTSYQVLAAFDRPYSHGTYPYGGLIQGTDGSFYGTTSSGGTASAGTIFKIDAAGALTSLHSFNGGDGRSPQAALIQGSDGSFYGTTTDGGAAGYGTVFKLDAAGALTSLHSFHSSDGANPYGRLLQASDASFYGTTRNGGAAGYGTVFKIDALGALTTLHSFDSSKGAYPSGGVIQASDGSLYGTTSGGAVSYGTIFRIDAARTLTTVHRFNQSDGAYPSGELTQGSDGSFYGTTKNGGAAGYGTVFKIDALGALTILHSFDSTSGAHPSGSLIQASNGSFYGTTVSGGAFGSGTIFKFDTAGAVTTFHSFKYKDGGSASGGVIEGRDGSFYGTTSQGGALGAGSIFRIDPAGTLTPLHGFGAVAPRNPQAGLIQAVDGSFLGTTSEGGTANRGTVFKVDAGTLTILHSFASAEGASPRARLLQASDGSFYGTTDGGGASSGYGTIFKIDAVGTLTTLHRFNNSSGTNPSGGLIEGGDGSFYGTTFYGGATGLGTVFKIDAAGTLTTLHNFNYVDGMWPSGGVIEGSDLSLYGVASSGGAHGCGTVFKIDPAGTLTTVHGFACGAGGASPYGGVLQGSDGDFYGMTQFGGSMGGGTIFKVKAAGTLTTLHSFEAGPGAAGTDPFGALIQGRDGSFYGTTYSSATGPGTIFKITAVGTLTTLVRFNTANGAYPFGGVIQGRDGSFYGTTSMGGANVSGVVFRLTVAMPTSTAIIVSQSPSMVGQSVALTASVTNAGFTPTGSVAFFDGSTSLGTATLNGGSATLHTATLAGGSHALRAEYGGATDFAPSASPVVTHIVVLPATFINPANGATNVDLTQPFTWTSVGGVQAYYLYVGTSLGAKDLVNTGEIQQTSYRVPATLATGATLYARLWTKVGGTWRFVDASFSAPPIARFTYPATSTTAVDPMLPLTWTTVPAAQAYYLYIGSTPGAKDLVNTGEIQQTSYLLRSTVPVNQMLYARLWTKVAGVWRFTDRTFSVMSLMARFTNPANAGTTIDGTQPLTWTSVASAQAYYLYVGSTLGARDLVNTSEIQQTSYQLRSTLPAGQMLYARLWTKAGGSWRYADTTFALATFIDFAGLTVNELSVSAYTEDGFSVQATSGEWLAVTTYGHPMPFIKISAPGGSTVSGEVRVSAGGAAFSFNSVDLYSSTTPIPYTITGLRNSSTVFTISGTLPNTFGEFRTVANANAAVVIDELSIVLTNSAAPCCGNPMGLDTIVLTR